MAPKEPKPKKQPERPAIRIYDRNGDKVDVSPDHPLFANYRERFPLDEWPPAATPPPIPGKGYFAPAGVDVRELVEPENLGTFDQLDDAKVEAILGVATKGDQIDVAVVNSILRGLRLEAEAAARPAPLAPVAPAPAPVAPAPAPVDAPAPEPAKRGPGRPAKPKPAEADPAPAKE